MQSREEEFTEGTVEGQEFFINRTGIMVNPEMAAELIQGAKETVPSSEGDGENMRAERAEYLQEGAPIGSPPTLVNATEMDNTEKSPPADNRMAVLLDKLGERLAFERQGTRLYEAFLQKVESIPVDEPNAPEVENLRHICGEELEHFELLQQAIVKLGGDATVETPSADIAGVLSHGVLQVVSDPRTTIAQTLQAILTAELADNDGWHMLRDLTEQLGYDDLAKQCAEALQQEQEHLESVRTWLSNMTLTEAVGEAGLMEVEVGAEVDVELPAERKDEPTKKAKRRAPRSRKRKKR
jgi:rubrerythrin